MFGFVLAIPTLRYVNRWYVQAISFGVLVVLFGAMTLISFLITSPLENCSIANDHDGLLGANGEENATEATSADIANFSLLALALLVLNLGPNVCAFIIAVDTSPTWLHQGAYFGCVAAIGKLGALCGWLAIRAIQNAVEETSGDDGPPSQPAQNCSDGWVFVASIGACVIGSITAIPTLNADRASTTRLIRSTLAPKDVNWGAIRQSVAIRSAASRHSLLAGQRLTTDQRRPTGDAQNQNSLGENADFVIPFNRIKLGRRFAAGGGGQLYKGSLDGEPVALKELFETMMSGSTQFLLHEANMLMRLQHPNMVRFFGVARGAPTDGRFQSERQASTSDADQSSDEDENAPADLDVDAHVPLYIVTEFCSGGNIGQLMLQRSGSLYLTHMLKYCVDLTKVMRFLHHRPSPIVHLDLKPENLLLEFPHPTGDASSFEGIIRSHTNALATESVANDGRRIDHLPRLKLCDLGVAKIQSNGAKGGIDNSFVGTVIYMPPEMMEQEATWINGTAADVYSAALSFYFMLTNLVPYSVRNLNDAQVLAGLVESQIRPLIPDHFPPQLAELLQVMWAQQPAERVTFGVAARVLREVLQSELKRPGPARLCGGKTAPDSTSTARRQSLSVSSSHSESAPPLPPISQRIQNIRDGVQTV